MALGIYEEEDIRAIAEEIRFCKGGGGPMTVKEMKGEITNVKEFGFSEGWSDGYNIGLIKGNEQGRTEGLEEGKAIGYAEGKTDGIAEGKKSQYDEFWDAYQRGINGISQIYSGSYMFANAGWNDDTFKPKYSMPYLNNASNMFNTCDITDLSAALARQGVVFDFSKCVSVSGAFAYSRLTKIPEISTVGANQYSGLNSIFNYSRSLHTIEKLILKDDGSQRFSSSFDYCESLANIIIEGVIGQNGFNVQWSTKLSHDSLMSIINALKDNSGTDTWNTITLGPDNIAKLSQDELNIMHLKQWEYA